MLQEWDEYTAKGYSVEWRWGEDMFKYYFRTGSGTGEVLPAFGSYPFVAVLWLRKGSLVKYRSIEASLMCLCPCVDMLVPESVIQLWIYLKLVDCS